MSVRSPGRPRLYDPEVQTRRNVTLSARLAATAAAIGGGSASEGIRRALESYRWVAYQPDGPILGIGESRESALSDAHTTCPWSADMDLEAMPCTMAIYRRIEEHGGEIRYRIDDGIVSLHDDNEE